MRTNLILPILLLLCLPLAAAVPTVADLQKNREAVQKQNELARQKLKISPQTLTDEQIVAAMKKGVDFLLKSMKENNWESAKSWATDPKEGEFVGGETALALLALLEAGQSLDDPRLRYRSLELASVVDYITKLQSDRIYVLALQSCVLAQLPQVKDQPYNAALTRIKDKLVAAAEQSPAYGYSVKKENNRPIPPTDFEALFSLPFHGRALKYNWLWDNSNSQYALLGVWAAADAGLSVPADYWALQDAHWRATQCKSGGWTYNCPINQPVNFIDYVAADKTPHTISHEVLQKDTMAAAGLASLYITQEFTDTELRTEPKNDPNLAAALKHFADVINVYAFNDLYQLYGIERVGLASGYKYFNNLDWYRQVACTLLASQQKDGSWLFQENAGKSANVGTAYALLILARGRNPILFNKLEYAGGGGTWNARPRDTANLTRWASKNFERPLNWQIVNLTSPPTEWLDAPILVITGSRDPKFTPDDIAKLKTFIDHGGLIFSSTDGAAETFTTAIKKLARDLTDAKSEFRPLPKDHFVYTAHYPIKPPLPPMLGLSNAAGDRDIWIHSPTDLAAAWQRKAYLTQKPPFEIPANLYFHVTTGEGPHTRKLTPRLQPLPQ